MALPFLLIKMLSSTGHPCQFYRFAIEIDVGTRIGKFL